MTLTGFARSQTADAVQEEHRQLHDLTAAISGAMAREPERGVAAWRAQLASRLQDLTLRLSAHFATEENGLFEEIEAAAPESAPACERLLAEHGALLHRLARLSAAAREGAGDERPLREEVRALLADLARHEERENELVLEAFDGSVGAGD